MNIKHLKETLAAEYPYRIELHAHTHPASKCSEIPPQLMAETYKNLGFDGLVLTNHFLRKEDMFKAEYMDFYMADYEQTREAGERLGFLPGDLQNKVDPYLRPLYDALYDMLGPETFQKYQERGSIEVAPLAYMRGRTLDDSFIILDEAQNTTREQMKMFLTRLGFGSKIVITGDVTQIDLPDDKVSGLKDAVRVLDNVKDIAICRLTSADVVRHALVQQIINAYEKAEKKKEEQKNDQNFKGKYQRKN